ncbi:bifunctional [glutamine synthetase] adenylyltransferase/[glutamine synthetase]-adenylyl-L-tyrosine phosphorylase [Corynebacterium epidermidicanis]|uniref:Glutamine synthetase adenylyltransferase n=1 Tax=Corynebacterium epidermidicanis TaxID=1050174 RepID=A0A0G3GQV5_9CORY|nr:bifunctional [glutamine synthetase] adenylyltransferase/[glutamine synthetase]-adenylyl-L-tyrosine phosphorylase [Corynebacterium epidermidicanis]AKK03591.1 glutamine synthetase adenylyltransferase [Corynebacterium epidermidicanis]
MTTPRSSRSLIPTPGALSLTSSTARADLEMLGWDNAESLDLLWALSGAGDADLALNQFIRLTQTLVKLPAEEASFNATLREDVAFRVRLMSLLGASSALGDHLVAHPELWSQLCQPLPDRQEMMREMLGCVEAVPAGLEGDSAVTECDTEGTYRAGIVGLEAERSLQQHYRTLLMRIAAHDLAGTYPENDRRPGQPQVPFPAVSAALADLADAALTAALAVAVTSVYGEQQPGQLAVIAMGKCGARELNYISDVDVIFVGDQIDAKLLRLAGEMMRIGSKCFFEVDAALRPEGKAGALVRTLESHVTYYERWAETWEFQALLKARPMTGYTPLGLSYRQALESKIWEASTRDSFVADVQAMRRRVIDNVPEDLRERELKLGVGGLRDVEFAVQLLQMVHGRSDETLRVLSTVDALAALIAGGYIGREDGQALIADYEFLRLLEHRLQLQRLKRTHTMPAQADEHMLRWLARSTGIVGAGAQKSAEILAEEFRRVRLDISSLHSKLFYRPLLESITNMSVDTLRLSPEAAKRQLAALNYQFPDRAYEHLSALAAGSSRKAKLQAILLPTLMGWLADTADPDAGLLNYRKLSDVAYDRQWFLRMLRDEGVVGQRLMHILGTSPYISDLLLATPDAVKLLRDGANGPMLLETDPEAVSTALVSSVRRHADPDKAVKVARGLRRVELTRIAAADLLGLMDVKEVCAGLSRVWDAVLDAAFAAEIASATAEGAQAPARIAVIGMGRLGGQELGYGSDADVMFVCAPHANVTENDAVKWATGVCDRVRARLSKPSQDPSLEVDLGLRPEGRSGAVVRTMESYERYYRQWGEVWEIQALLRAAPIAGDQLLGEQFIKMIDQFRYPPSGASQKTVQEVRRMKARVDNERLPRGADRNMHTKLGRGGLTDIEWTVQLLTMLHSHEVPELHTPSTLVALDVIEEHKLIPPAQVETLRVAWLTATRARNALVLVRGKRTDELPPSGPHLGSVAAAAGWNRNQTQEFLDFYLKVTRRARSVVDEVFWGEPTPTH